MPKPQVNPDSPPASARDPARGSQPPRRTGRRLRRAFSAAALAFPVFWIAFLVFLDYAAETTPFTAFLIYLPPLLWAMPPAGLLALCLLLQSRRAAALNAAALGFVLFAYMDFHLHVPRPRAAATLTLLTNNTGQDAGTSPQAFIEAADPDVIVFEDRRYYPKLMADPRRPHRVLGEFIVFSKFPILDLRFPPGLVYGRGRHPFAVRAEIALPSGRRIAVYAFHLPSPRRGIEALRGEGFRCELKHGGGLLSPKNWQRFQAVTRARIRAGEKLARTLEQEKLPWIAAGDMNTPDHGILYRVFARRFTDAFARAGFGYGFTFPGRTRNPLALGGPWMRLDYIFASPEWRPRFCRVEPARPSQHRAVVARLVLR